MQNKKKKRFLNMEICPELEPGITAVARQTDR
jgi:hypothetical protein